MRKQTVTILSLLLATFALLQPMSTQAQEESYYVMFYEDSYYRPSVEVTTYPGKAFIGGLFVSKWDRGKQNALEVTFVMKRGNSPLCAKAEILQMGTKIIKAVDNKKLQTEDLQRLIYDIIKKVEAEGCPNN